MKKLKYFLIIPLSLLFLNGFSQFHFGAKIGGSSASLSGMNIKNFKPTQRTYFHGGGVVNYSFTNFLSLQAELMYSGKGTSFGFTAENQVYKGEVKIDQRLGYFSVPLMIQLNFGSDPRSNFHINGGIVNSWLIHDKFSGNITVEDAGQMVTKDFTYQLDLNKQDFGYAFGVGLLANGIMFDFRYEQGTKSIYGTAEGNPNVRNRAFMVSIGYLF